MIFENIKYQKGYMKEIVKKLNTVKYASPSFVEKLKLFYGCKLDGIAV